MYSDAALVQFASGRAVAPSASRHPAMYASTIASEFFANDGGTVTVKDAVLARLMLDCGGREPPRCAVGTGGFPVVRAGPGGLVIDTIPGPSALVDRSAGPVADPIPMLPSADPRASPDPSTPTEVPGTAEPVGECPPVAVDIAVDIAGSRMVGAVAWLEHAVAIVIATASESSRHRRVRTTRAADRSGLATAFAPVIVTPAGRWLVVRPYNGSAQAPRNCPQRHQTPKRPGTVSAANRGIGCPTWKQDPDRQATAPLGKSRARPESKSPTGKREPGPKSTRGAGKSAARPPTPPPAHHWLTSGRVPCPDAGPRFPAR